MNDVTLREYIERIFAMHDQHHAIQHEAVQVAAAELARRLADLNHAHERAQQDRATFVTRELFDQRTGSVDGRIQSLENFRGRAGLIATGVAITAGTFGAIVGAIIVHILLR